MQGVDQCTPYDVAQSMQFKESTLMALADLICGNSGSLDKGFFVYRSSSALTRFFRDCDIESVHDGSTRNYWVAGELKKILSEPHPNAQTPPAAFSRLVATLMEQADALNEGSERPQALVLLNKGLAREGFEAFYAEDRKCYLRHIRTKSVVSTAANPHRPLSSLESKKRAMWISSCRHNRLCSNVS